MVSPLAPILAEIFLSHQEENYLNKFPIEFKASFCIRYVDVIFVIFELPESTHSFREYLLFKQLNINFTDEHGNIDSILFLDVKSCRKNDNFVTIVDRKATFSGVFTNY